MDILTTTIPLGAMTTTTTASSTSVAATMEPFLDGTVGFHRFVVVGYGWWWSHFVCVGMYVFVGSMIFCVNRMLYLILR